MEITSKELTDKIINRQHHQMIWVALAVNIVATYLIYTYFFKGNLPSLLIGITISLVILLGKILKKNEKISGQFLGIIPMVTMSVYFAFVYHNLAQLQLIREFTYLYMGIFIGGGMFLLLKSKYTLSIFALTIAFNSFFYIQYSYVHIPELLFNGGIAVILMSSFMVISIYMRYNLILKNAISTKQLIKSKKKTKASEIQNRILFNKNPRPMLIYAVDDLSILDVNDTIINKYGYSKSEFLKMKITDIRPKESSKLVIEDVANVKRGVEKVSEWVHLTKMKEKIDVEISATFIDYFDQKARMVLIKDITKSKKEKEELKIERENAIKANKNQSQFLSNMSHEIRTPMNGILGMTRLLKETKLTEDQNKYTKAIYTSADNLMVIINEILDFSKIEAGKLTTEKIPFNLQELTDIWEGTLQINSKEKNIGFDINVDSNVPNNLIGDPIRLNQIIYNLGGNAIKFTENGKVVIDISVKEKKEKNICLQVDVTDNGIGIPKDKLESIFSSFSQASTSTTRKYGGTGLGLTITKQLVELLDGKIWVESDEGKGSTFSFTINYQVQKSSESIEYSEVESFKNNLGKLNVLLVKDHDINQILATTVLEGWNFKVDLAENGEEAVNKVSHKHYDVILMDIHMPKMDGYQATQKIRKKLNNNTPVIAMTASAHIGDNKKCFEVGMNDYISKPFDPEILLKKITAQINKEIA